MDQSRELAGAEQPSGSDELLEASWTDRDRAVRGRELRLELLITAGFLVGLTGLLALAGPIEAPHPMAALVLVAYAVAARSDFAIGSGHVVPTQVFLVPMFALAPAALVPALVFAGLAIGVMGEGLLGRSRFDRLAYCGGDGVHALGPALVLTLLAGGDAVSAAPEVLLLAFVAQLAFDFASSSLHDRLVFGTRPELHARVLLQVWGVDAALAPVGLLAAELTTRTPWAALAPVPLVALLSAIAADRGRRIKSAHDRLEALRFERRRREAAVLRVGDALASNLDLEALLELVGRAATEALDGNAGRAGPVGERPPAAGPGAGALEEAERVAPAVAPEIAVVERDGHHAVAGVIGEPSDPIGVISVVRAAPFAVEERSLLVYLCGQAAVSAGNVAQHELLRDAEARLRHQAFHDGLTGLANRALFGERVAEAIRRRSEQPQAVAVIYLDLDGFKLVNDTLGHDAGDELLVVAARRVRGCLRQGDVAARLGGDEFAVLLEDLEGPEGAEAIAERLRLTLREPVRIRDRDFMVRASIGTALGSADADHESLLRRADLAMYVAKGAGGDRVERFRSEMLTQADVRGELAGDLRGAAAQGELELHFQPIIELERGHVQAVEALARWRHPARGLLAPSAFIELAEQTGAIRELGEHIVDEACRVAAGWPAVDGQVPPVSVNVSSVQLRSTTFAAHVAGSLARHGLPAAGLVLEVTESVAMASDEETQDTLNALRDLGVALALDDFGSGYSSLSHLARMQVDVLKLDRAFLAGIDELPAQARLVGGVIQLAATLGVPVIAEGIERPAQLERLLELGGRIGQGYLLGAPMQQAALDRRLRLEAATPSVGVAAA
jgi:diguanylate cyclase (GGDEF)-like protein